MEEPAIVTKFRKTSDDLGMIVEMIKQLSDHAGSAGLTAALSNDIIVGRLSKFNVAIENSSNGLGDLFGGNKFPTEIEWSVKKLHKTCQDFSNALLQRPIIPTNLIEASKRLRFSIEIMCDSIMKELHAGG